MTESKKLLEALEKARKDFDIIYEAWEERDYVEVRGSFCGDMRDYRYYDNGLVTER